MKIAIFTPSFLPKCSGAEIFHHNLATQLARRGHKPVVIAPKSTLRSIRQAGMQLPYPLAGFPANAWSLFKRSPWLALRVSAFLIGNLQSRYRFDVWHGVMTWPTGISLIHWNGGRRHTPYLVRCAGDDVLSDPERKVGLRLDPQIDQLVRTMLPRAPRLISLSESISAEYERIGVRADRISLVSNAVDLSRFQQKINRALVRQRLEVPEEATIFLSVGRNHPQKDYPTLLKAAKKLLETESNSYFLIVGRDTSKLESAVSESGLSGRVLLRHVGSVEGAVELPSQELLEMYLAADVFVMPSLMEGFSSALLEAMAAGLPVITTDAPGCREFVRFGKDAVVVPISDPEALAGAMRRMIREASFKADYAFRSRARAAEFDWPRVVDVYENLYRQLIVDQLTPKTSSLP